jgi:hypothetical protein
MKRLSLNLAILFAICCGLLAQSSHVKDEAAIRAQIAGYAAARQTGDGHAQALFYTEDADEWGSAAREMTEGRAALEKSLALPPDPNRTVKFQPIHFTFLHDDVALVDSLYGSPQPIGHAMYVMVKRNGKWLIRSARIVRFPPAAEK